MLALDSQHRGLVSTSTSPPDLAAHSAPPPVTASVAVELAVVAAAAAMEAGDIAEAKLKFTDFYGHDGSHHWQIRNISMTTNTANMRPQLILPVSQRDHIQGPATAAVTLVEYGDYQCSHCGHAHPIVKNVQEIMGSRMRFVFRNFPVSSIHPNAQHAAEAAEAAGAQGKFWEMHDYLFEHQDHLEDADLLKYAAKIGLDVVRFNENLQAHTFAARVREDMHSGVRSGVNGTPTFFINGIRHDGPWDIQSLTTALVAAAQGRL